MDPNSTKNSQKSSLSGSRFNSDKLYQHAKRQKDYKKDLKAWYDQKKFIEEGEHKYFNPQLGQKTVELSKKRELNVIEHAKEYA